MSWKIEIKECVFRNVRILKNWGLSINFELKKEDLTEDLRKRIEEAWQTSEVLAWVFVSFWEEENKIFEKNSKTENLSKLYFLMEKYCEQEWITLFDEIQKIYKKYNVTSRRDLSEKDLENEIESYKLGLYYN